MHFKGRSAFGSFEKWQENKKRKKWLENEKFLFELQIRLLINNSLFIFSSHICHEEGENVGIIFISAVYPACKRKILTV